MKTAYIYNFLQRWSFALAVFIVLLMNYLSNAIPFGGVTMAEMSARYPTLITPAGYAFSIWGVIYLALAVFAFFQLTRGKNIRFYALVWPFFMVNALANVLWLLAFQNDLIGISVLLMAVILGTLFAMMRLFYRLRKALGTTHRFFFQVPFSLYFGWISVASMVNVAAFLVSIDMTFFTSQPELFSVILLSIGALLSLYILLSQNDYIFNFAIIWAYVAIWVGSTDSDLVMNMAKFSAIGLTVAAIVAFAADRVKVAQYGRQTS
jgi:hypothetical protein